MNLELNICRSCEQLGHIEEIRRKFGGVTNVQE
jgi:hypothetical protein